MISGNGQMFSSGSLEGKRIAAVFATMNRREVACECLRLLDGQSLPLHKVFVTDNASSDGTAEAIEQIAASLQLEIVVIRPPENLGNAGGVQIAMDRAFADGFDHVWILDDDSWPDPSALSDLVGNGPEGGIRTSLVLEPGSNRISWPFEIRQCDRRWALVEEIPPSEGWFEVRRSWLGALISKEAYATVGAVNADLFLRGEDEDYPRRLEHAGYKFWMAASSVLRHPIAGPFVSLSFGEHKLCLERNLSADKLYYRIRNMLWIKNRESGPLVSLILVCGYFLLLLRWFRPVGPSLGIFSEAVRDAFAGRLGRRAAGAVKT